MKPIRLAIFYLLVDLTGLGKKGPKKRRLIEADGSRKSEANKVRMLLTTNCYFRCCFFSRVSMLLNSGITPGLKKRKCAISEIIQQKGKKEFLVDKPKMFKKTSTNCRAERDTKAKQLCGDCSATVVPVN